MVVMAGVVVEDEGKGVGAMVAGVGAARAGVGAGIWAGEARVWVGVGWGWAVGWGRATAGGWVVALLAGLLPAIPRRCQGVRQPRHPGKPGAVAAWEAMGDRARRLV